MFTGSAVSKTAAYIGLGLIVLFLVLVYVSLARASTTSHKNSLGAVIPYENPNQYIFGRIIVGTLIESGNKQFINIRFQPSHTFELYTEEVLFCRPDDVLDKLAGKSNPVVVTYERLAHDSVQNIGCHNLIGVSEVKKEVIQ
jgi:hypothetical protein